MMFKELVLSYELNDVEFEQAKRICRKPWAEFSTIAGRMSKHDCIRVLKYLAENRPTSTTLGQRVVQRFNSLNKVRWEDLVNGKREDG